MKKILLIDDSLTVLNALRYRAESGMLFNPVCVSSYAEAQSAIESGKFFAAIVDLMLPDCERGEAVKLTTSQGIPTIVMTASLNEELRKKMLRFPIVDYLMKSSIDEIGRAVSLAEELISFKNKQVLILESNRVLHKLLSMYFEQLLCKVVLVDNPAAAIEVLRGEHKIAVVTVSNERSDLAGSEFVKQIREDPMIRKNGINKDVVIFGLTSSTKEEVYSSFIKNGANDVLRVPFTKEEFNAKLVNVMRLVNQHDELSAYIKTIDEYVITSETDLSGKITYASRAFEKISGYTKEELIGNPHNIVRHPSMPKEIYADLWKTIKSGNEWHGEICNRHKEGHAYWVEVHIRPKFDNDGEITGYRAIRTDITEKKKIEELSKRDGLTQLYNRRYFNTLIPIELRRAQREGRMVGLIMLDIDNFKAYNDTYGHQKGDDALIQVAGALEEISKRASDIPFRIGGEEFALFFLPENPEGASAFAEAVRLAVEGKNIEHRKNSTFGRVTVSIGLVVKPAEEMGIEKLYQEADAALYRAKEEGRNRIVTVPGIFLRQEF